MTIPNLALLAAPCTLASCGGANGDPPIIEMRALSSRGEAVTGGDALVEVVVPTGVTTSQVKVTINDGDATSFVEGTWLKY